MKNEHKFYAGIVMIFILALVSVSDATGAIRLEQGGAALCVLVTFMAAYLIGSGNIKGDDAKRNQGGDSKEKQCAIGVLINGMAEGWEPATNEEEAIKEAYSRSMEDSLTHCIMSGIDSSDENAKIVYLVVGGSFYKSHDL